MKRKEIAAIVVAALGLTAWLVGPTEAASMGTAFTYQGRLMDAHGPADGLYDFEFRLYDSNDPCTGTQQGGKVEAGDIDVIDGYFTAELDFGSDAFDGDARWLGILVRPGDSNDPNAFVSLSPRQKIAPTPYATYARKAGYGVPFVLTGSVGYPGTLFSAINNDDGSAVRGESVGSGGAGVEGKHVESGNWGWIGCSKFGVWGQAEGGTDIGVMGDHHESGSYGILGRNLYGVYGYNGSSQNHGYIGGTDYAVYGQHDTSSNYGYIGDVNYGVYGYAGYPENDYHYGGYFEAEGYYGRGVYGKVAGERGAGVKGYATGDNSIGVSGVARELEDPAFVVGVQGYATGRNAHGVDGIGSGPNTVGVYARGSTLAGHFDGKVYIEGNVGIDTYPSPSCALSVDGIAAKPGGGSWAVLSDLRMKKNICEINSALDLLLRLRGVRFEYTDQSQFGYLPGEQIGMIAQEVEGVFPEWVAEDGDGYKSVMFRGFEALTVEALRQLREVKDREIAELKRENDEIRSRLVALENRLKTQ